MERQTIRLKKNQPTDEIGGVEPFRTERLRTALNSFGSTA